MIKPSIRLAVFVTFLSLAARPALSQTDMANGFYVEHFTDENGLPQNSINDLLFDGRGYLWLASQVGLIRFDGRSFSSYVPPGKPALESNFVRLGRDSRGFIFGQTDDRGLYGLSGGPGAPDSHLLNSHKQLVDFGSFLAGEGGAGPGEKKDRRLIFNYLTTHIEDFFMTSPSQFYYVFRGALWYYSEGAVTRAGGGVTAGGAAEGGQAGGMGQVVAIGNRLYFLKGDSVAAAYEEGRQVGGKCPLRGDLRGDLTAHRISAGDLRLFTGSGNLLLAGKRLYQIFGDPDGGLDTRWLIDLDPIDNISAVAADTLSGLLFVTSQTEGFYLLRKSRFKGPAFAPALRKEMDRYLFGPMALRGTEVITDRFVFGASGAYRLLPDQNPPWQRCLFLDKSGRIWGGYGDTPREMTANMELIRSFPAFDGEIVDFGEDSGGNLYCLTERSLWRLDRSDFRRIFENDEKSGKNESFSLVSPNLFWVATTRGLLEFNISAGTARRLPDLAGSHVRSIHSCRDGSVLLGTYGQGYVYYRKGQFFHMPLDKNGYLITAHCFLEDDKGFVWIPCNKGLFKVPKRDLDAWCDSPGGLLYYYYYGRQDGLHTNEFNGGFNESGLIMPDGLITLLSMKGMVCFYADSLRSDLPPGPIDMARLEIDGRPEPVNDLIRLPSGYENLSLVITCPFLGDRNNLYLEYAISGLSEGWTELGSDGSINLSRLSPGHYRLQVRKVNGFGRDNFSYRHWDIVVVPRFYQTAWFKGLIGVLGLLLIFLLVRSQFMLRQKRRELQEKAENLERSRRALLQTNKMREKLISLVIHDLRSPIRFLSMMANDLHENLGELTPQETRERSYWIRKGTQDLYTFSEDLLLWVTSQKNNFSISKRPVPIQPLLQEMAEFFREQLNQKRNCLDIEASPGLSLHSDPHILITILRNLVDNANKYTSNGKIKIRAYQETAHTVLSVADTGKGMTAAQIAVYLNRENLDGIRSGTQLGHQFILDLTYRMNGTVSISSQEGAGTIVVLRFDRDAAEVPQAGA
ncbi:MAG: ATP-binding protein [Bacteroidota bacterium]|nr:ATP-binding protein [Bacteroidota bacterium]MDP4255185.1 ATP-binding protein [Bacteroidota bacterium]